MRCRDCEQEIEGGLREMKAHKKECHAKATERPEDAITEAKEPVVVANQEKPANPVIPWDRVNPALQVLARGTPLTFRIIGTVTKDGIEVKEVHPDRR